MQAQVLLCTFQMAQQAQLSWPSLTGQTGSVLTQVLQSQQRKEIYLMSRFTPPSEEELAARGIGISKVRARNSDGTLKADDPSTPDVNEAWEEKPVKKRGRPAKKKD
jgi:hypothetical protein